MARKLKDIMTTSVAAVARDTPLRDVARVMRDKQIGDVLVTDRGALVGILTDRDLVVRGIAEGKAPDTCKAGDVCSPQVVQLDPEATDEEAVRLMRQSAVRRIPVVKNGTPVGIVSIGDLAQLKDPNSALAEISSAPANR